jgi:hypothetical protein
MIGQKTIRIYKAGARYGTAIALSVLFEARKRDDLDRLAGHMADHLTHEVPSLLSDRDEIARLIRPHLDNDDEAEIEIGGGRY